MTTENLQTLPLLQNASRQMLEEYYQHAIVQRYRSGEIIAFEGQESPHFFVVISGDIRVYKLGENGREASLYHVRSNEGCMLTAYSILTQSPFRAYAVVEKEADMVLIPAPVFRDWLNRFEVWRNYLFKTLSTGIEEILDLVDRVVFQRVDVRIARFLLSTVNGNGNQIRTTHEYLAGELGTSRVVVSRILENFERQKWIALSRARITVLDKRSLAVLSKKNGSM